MATGAGLARRSSRGVGRMTPEARATDRRAVRGCGPDRPRRAGGLAAPPAEGTMRCGPRLAGSWPSTKGATGARSCAPPGGGSAVGWDGERAPSCRSPLATAGAGWRARGRARERERRPGSQTGDRVAEGAGDDLRALGRRAGPPVRAADHLHPHPGGLDALESRRPRGGGRDDHRGGRDDHPGPDGPHRPALEPLPDPADPRSRPWSWGWSACSPPASPSLNTG